MIEEIKQILEYRNSLAIQAKQQYEPIVEHLIASRNSDSNKIRYTLDFMLDFCFDKEMMELYRKLCRYLYTFDPNSAAFYAKSYFEMYEEDKLESENDKGEETI